MRASKLKLFKPFTDFTKVNPLKSSATTLYPNFLNQHKQHGGSTNF